MLAQEKVRRDITMAMVARTTMTMVAMAVIHGMMETTVVICGVATMEVYPVAKEDVMVLQQLGGPGRMTGKVVPLDVESKTLTMALSTLALPLREGDVGNVVLVANSSNTTTVAIRTGPISPGVQRWRGDGPFLPSALSAGFASMGADHQRISSSERTSTSSFRCHERIGCLGVWGGGRRSLWRGSRSCWRTWRRTLVRKRSSVVVVWSVSMRHSRGFKERASLLSSGGSVWWRGSFRMLRWLPTQMSRGPSSFLTVWGWMKRLPAISFLLLATSTTSRRSWMRRGCSFQQVWRWQVWQGLALLCLGAVRLRPWSEVAEDEVKDVVPARANETHIGNETYKGKGSPNETYNRVKNQCHSTGIASPFHQAWNNSFFWHFHAKNMYILTMQHVPLWTCWGFMLCMDKSIYPYKVKQDICKTKIMYIHLYVPILSGWWG